jgi:hypothetical protein
MKVMKRIFESSQARWAACSRQHRTQLPGRLEAGGGWNAAREAERQTIFAEVPHLRGEASGAGMRVDAADDGKGQVRGTIQDCSIEVDRCLHL